MVWQPEIEELKHRKQLAEQMGGPEGIDRQHSRGKLTIRERIEALVDSDSFQEVGALAGNATYENDKLVAFTPANSVVGTCTLNGRKIALSGGDFTVRGGAADAAIGNKAVFIEKLASEWRIPFIRLLDATGGSVRTFEQIGRTYVPDSNPANVITSQLLSTTPVVSAVLGSVAGLPAVESCLAHFSLMVKGISQVFPGGPPVVKAALGYDITKEELGDERTQVYQSGVIDNLAETEQEAFDMIRRFLSYMPQNVWELPPRVESQDDVNRRDLPPKKESSYNVSLEG